MRTNMSNISICASSKAEKKAAAIFAAEILQRTGKAPSISDRAVSPCISFCKKEDIDSKDSFEIEENDSGFCFYASGIRGFIFAIGLFLRKTEYNGDNITLADDITGNHTPDKKIRGHQLGYRPLSNTYDAWTPEDYKRAYLDMMYFGANTVEHIPPSIGSEKRNELMQMTACEMLSAASRTADEFDLDVSLWFPNSEDNADDAAEHRRKVFSATKRIDAVFPPGGDPGSLPAHELFSRCKVFKEILNEYHPNAQMWPSAQAPHSISGWGDSFIEELDSAEDSIDGIITGPNHAFPINELRRKTPERYGIRFYPDITHNLRCEHPVHFDRDDWNYALAAANGRESANPRPVEYALLHRLSSRYTVGSVTYSEGVNDDLNKAVWCALEWDPDCDIYETVEDYARLFFYGTDTKKAADGIFGLEKNWEGAPETNPQIDNTLRIFEELKKDYPALSDNWRFLLCLFRAKTDAYVKFRVLDDRKAIKSTAAFIKRGELKKAREVLSSPYSSEIAKIRQDIEATAEKLFELIGIQLGTVRFHADGWERGAVLDTVDLPVSDRQWLLYKLDCAEKTDGAHARDCMMRALERNKVQHDEFYFSVALNGLTSLGEKQHGEFYIDTQADRPNRNNGTLPTALFKLYDHFSFHASPGGFSYNTDYCLMISYENSVPDEKCEFEIKANGITVYSGDRFGGTVNKVYTDEMLPDGYTAIMYRLPAECFENGCLDLEITEPHEGFKFGEFRITKRPYGEDRQ